MLPRHAISDADWARLAPLLPRRGPEGERRRFVDAVLFVAKTGVPWRDLPERFGNWNSVWRRFDRWAKKGVWRRVFDAMIASQQRRAEREISSYLASHGGLFTDDTEREIMRRLSGNSRRSV